MSAKIYGAVSAGVMPTVFDWGTLTWAEDFETSGAGAGAAAASSGTTPQQPEPEQQHLPEEPWTLRPQPEDFRSPELETGAEDFETTGAGAAAASSGTTPQLNWYQPEPEPPGPPQLPPGWMAVWHAPSGHFYYADFETYHSVWRPRPRYDGGDWRRWITEDGAYAYWFSDALQLSFWEDPEDDNGWTRRNLDLFPDRC